MFSYKKYVQMGGLTLPLCVSYYHVIKLQNIIIAKFAPSPNEYL